jgi:hypothetical protein
MPVGGVWAMVSRHDQVDWSIQTVASWKLGGNARQNTQSVLAVSIPLDFPNFGVKRWKDFSNLEPNFPKE